MNFIKNQQKQLDKYCEKMSKRELVTKTNRYKSERLALKMRKILYPFPELNEPIIHWFSNPKDAKIKLDRLVSKIVNENLGCKNKVTLNNVSPMDEVYSNLNIDLVTTGLKYHGAIIKSNYGIFDISADNLLAFHEKIKTFKLSDEASKYFKYYRKMRKYCFLRYSTNDHIILVENPKEIIKEDGDFRAWF